MKSEPMGTRDVNIDNLIQNDVSKTGYYSPNQQKFWSNTFLDWWFEDVLSLCCSEFLETKDTPLGLSSII